MTATSNLSRRGLLLALPVAACAIGAEDAATDTRFVMLVLMRHAEKADPDARDPDLSAAGRERAERLATLCGSSGATRLLVTEFKRTQETLEPLARALRAEPIVLAAADVDAWTAALREPTHRVTIAATHSNVLPRLAAAFGAELADLDAKGNLPDAEYGRVVVLTVRIDASSATAVAVLELRT